MDQRAAERIGEIHDVLIEELPDDHDGGTGQYGGRAAHQAPEVDGATQVRSDRQLSVGDIVRVRVSGSEGVDLLADVIDGHEQVHPGQLRTID
jgi:tRNA A37 methylthiotransferase MiaB